MFILGIPNIWYFYMEFNTKNGERFYATSIRLGAIYNNKLFHEDLTV
jgi:hypothetical protein